VTYFARYEEPASGFATVAGRDDGLNRIVLAAGRLGAVEGGPIHLHHGEEILRILSGEVDVTVGHETPAMWSSSRPIHRMASPPSPKPQWRSSPSSMPDKSSQFPPVTAQRAW
jgi:hypothetical protein